HQGQAPGLSSYTIGERVGEESLTLLTSQVPPHTHTANCSTNPGVDASPKADLWAVDGAGASVSFAAAANGAVMAAGALSSVGGGQPHENRQPFLALNFCIAMQGIFPSRN